MNPILPARPRKRKSPILWPLLWWRRRKSSLRVWNNGRSSRSVRITIY